MPLTLNQVSTSRGPRWVGDGLRLFARRPVAFTAMFALFVFAAAVASLLPVLGSLLQLMALPLLSLGFMVAGQSALLGGPVGPGAYFEPLRGAPAQRTALIKLCVAYGVIALLLLILADAVSHSAWARIQRLMAKGTGTQADVDAILAEPGVMAGTLLALGGGALLSVPFWHAPALVHWGGQGARQALFSSTLAIWRNKGAFIGFVLAWMGMLFFFGLVAAVLFALLGVPQLVGVMAVPAWLLSSTVFYLSVLFTFSDSFGGAPLAGPTPDAPTETD